MRTPILHTLIMKLYGIPNCSTVKAARAWFADRGLTVVFHDFKKNGVPESRLEAWLCAAGWEKLVNRRGTTWRALDDTIRQSVVDNASARAVLLAHPSLIKRPVLEAGDRLVIGFDESAYESLNP